MKLELRILKRNHQLYKENRILKKYVWATIKDEDGAIDRNKKAVEYIDEVLKDDMEIVMWKRLRKIRKILTCYETNNVLDEVNRK